MKAFVVLAVCISACVAVPNGYGAVRVSSYPAPVAQAPAPVLYATTAAPVVLRNSYSSYEQPAYAQPAEVRVIKKEIPIVRYAMDTDHYGTYNLETVSADQTNTNQQGTLKNLGDKEGPVNVMKGSYSYIGDDSKTYTVNYVADENGFRAEGAHLPTPHPEIQAALMMMGPGSD